MIAEAGAEVAVDSAKLLAFVGSSQLTGAAVVGSRLWENKARELMGPGVPEVNLPLCYPGSCVTSVLLNKSLFLWITQVIHTHENTAICSILISCLLLLAFSHHLYYLPVVFYKSANQQSILPFHPFDAEGFLLVWYLDPFRKKDGFLFACV